MSDGKPKTPEDWQDLAKRETGLQESIARP